MQTSNVKIKIHTVTIVLLDIKCSKSQITVRDAARAFLFPHSLMRAVVLQRFNVFSNLLIIIYMLLYLS
jgi:diphthamide biosynthesis methyltransferase